MSALRRIAPLALLAAVSGCELIPTARSCSLEPKYAIELEVRDAQTGAPAAFGARAQATSGTASDSLQTVGAGFMDPATLLEMRLHRGAGTYSVIVQKTGYRDWTRDGVIVRRGECGVLTERLRADLQRAP